MQVALPFVDRVEGVGLGAVATLAVVLGRQLLQHRLSAERTNVTSHVQRRVRNLRTAERTFVQRELNMKNRPLTLSSKDLVLKLLYSFIFFARESSCKASFFISKIRTYSCKINLFVL